MMKHRERIELVEYLIRLGRTDDEILLSFVHLEDFDVRESKFHIGMVRDMLKKC